MGMCADMGMYCKCRNCRDEDMWGGFFFNDTATTEIYTLSLHDALPICFSVQELKVSKVPCLEMGGSNGFLFRN